MAETICMANFKGGVGKSTTAVNVAASLALRGSRTLLVDCDPQANTSEMFIPEPEITRDMRSVIAERIPVAEVIRKTRIPDLQVLPATFDLAYLDKELVVSPAGIQRIERAIRPIEDRYDYIVFDTGPNLSHLTLGALAAARHIVIPVSASVWSTTGLHKFVRWIDQNREDEVISARLLGLVATMVDVRTRIGRSLLADLPRGTYPAFSTFIPRRVGAEDAVMEGAVVGEPAMDTDLSTAYEALTAEIITRVADIREQEGRHRVR